MNILLTLIELLGGLGLFVSGMNLMSHGIEKVAGKRLRSILAAFTKNRFLGLIVGLFFTAVIQSSSAATVMTVSFVNSGLMQLSEACGIILGANIGTTVTALLVSFRLNTVAPIFVFAGAIMVHYMKPPMAKKSGEIVLGFGLLFVGISTMSSAMDKLRDIPAFIGALQNFTNPWLAILLGLVITSIVQSSSVTVSILVVMGAQKLIGLDICMYVILGCNIGACTSAMLASMDGSKNAKRTALIHLLFNVFGTVLMFILLEFFSKQICYFIRLISGFGDDAGTLGRNIAVTHFVFKLFQVIVFYPFMNGIIRLTYLIVPGEDKESNVQEEFKLQYINMQSLPNPAIAIYVAVQEIKRMAGMACDNLNKAVNCFLTGNQEEAEDVKRTEKYIDFLNDNISAFLVKINQNAIPLEDAATISAYFHVITDIERIGDHAESIVDVAPKLYEKDVKISKKGVKEIGEMMDLVNKMLGESVDMFVTGKTDNMQEISALEDSIDQMEADLQDRHIKRLKEGKCSAEAGIYFSDLLSGLERVGDHAINIAFSILEAKNGVHHN